MLLIYPSTWPYDQYTPWSLVSGDRCLYLYDWSSTQALARAGIPQVQLTLRDYAVMHKTHTGPNGEIMFYNAAWIEANVPSTWDGS